MALLGLLVASVVDHHSSADPVLKAAPPPTVKETKTALPLERAAGAAGGDFSAVADPTANLRELARGGANALYALATLSETGKGVARDPRAAYDLYERAAEIGHPAALYRLAIIHGDRGTDADRIRATEYLTRAARLGYAPAQRELLRLQDQQSTTGEPTVPSYAIARAARGHLAGLETADQAARLAHLQLRSAFTAGSVSDLRAAWAASFTAETQLDNLRYAAWTNIVMTERTPVLLSEALQLAFLDLQVEVRRRVGPLAHTVVPGLETAPGCAGDIVAERLVATYGRQVSTLVADVSNVADEARLLQRLAFQMACLGERQMILLEWGLGSGFVDVEGRMRSNGLGRLIPAFARLMAPLQVLVMDTQKHRGSRSFAYQWFALYQPELQTAIAQGGWASKGGLSIWNCQSAGLLIVPNCQEGQRSPNCVDTLAFLRSLADPRSLGFGDCALSGMITAGLIEGEQGGSRYTCPSLGCDTNGAPRSDDANLQWTRDRLTEEQGPWPDDRGTTVLPDNQSLCRSPSDQDFQGAGGNMDACRIPWGRAQSIHGTLMSPAWPRAWVTGGTRYLSGSLRAFRRDVAAARSRADRDPRCQEHRRIRPDGFGTTFSAVTAPSSRRPATPVQATLARATPRCRTFPSSRAPRPRALHLRAINSTTSSNRTFKGRSLTPPPSRQRKTSTDFKAMSSGRCKKVR